MEQLRISTLLIVVFFFLLLVGDLSARTRWAGRIKGFEPDQAVLTSFDDLEAYLASLSPSEIRKGKRRSQEKKLRSLAKKLRNAEAAYIRGNPCAAANILRAFLKHAQALRRGKRMEVAEDLYNRGRNLRVMLLGSLPEEITCRGHGRATKPTKVLIKESDNSGIDVTVSFQEPKLQTIRTEQGVFTQLQLPGTAPGVGTPGFPDVPILRRLIAVPRGATVVVSATPLIGETIQLNLYPIQPQPTDQASSTGGSPFAMDADVYETDEWFPGEVCRVEMVGRMRDVVVAELACAAGQYNPARDTLNLFSSVDIQVSFVGGTGNFVTEAALNPFDHTLEMAEGLVMNSDILGSFVGQTGEPAEINGEELLILTHPDFRQAADRLAEWKMEKWIISSVFEVNDGAGPGPDNAGDIDDFIEDRYGTATVRPSYVLLLGDVEFIPTFYVPAQNPDLVGSETIGSDYPYAVVQNPTDPFDALVPDLAVGRIPVDTLDEANIVVDKIIQYESDPPKDPSFYGSAALAAQFQCCRDDVDEDGTAQRTFVEVSEFPRGVLEDHGYEVERIYTETVAHKYFIKERNLLVSEDGIEWALGYAGASKMWRDVAHGDGLFVAVGDGGSIATSRDGIQWTSRDLASGEYLSAVAYGKGRFVAIGSGASFTSPDGVNWTAHSSSVLDGKYLWDIGYWDSKEMFVAVGSGGTIVTSTDGVNWTVRSSPATLSLHRIAFREDLAVAVGMGGHIVTSSDGSSWTAPNSNADGGLYGVACSEDLIVVVGNGGITAVSSDGNNWSVKYPAAENLNSVTVLDDGTFLATGWGGTILTYDGVNWNLRTSASLRRFSTALRIAQGNGIFVGIGFRDAAPRRYYDGTQISADIGPESGFAWDGDTEDIVSAFNSGRFLIMHRDHGFVDRWVHPQFTRDDVTESLENGNLLPVVFSVNCASGVFDIETAKWPFGPGDDENLATSFTEALLRKVNGGAVGVLGDTRFSPSWPNTYMAKGFFDAIWPDAIPDFGGDNPRRRLGDILNHGKLYMISQIGALIDLFGSGEAVDETLDEYYLWHAFGDPTLEIWTQPPFPLPMDHTMTWNPDSLQIGYSVEGATITAFQIGPEGVVPVGRSEVVEGVATLYFVLVPDPELPVMLSASYENGVNRLLTPPSLVADQINDVPASTSLSCGVPPGGLGSLFQSFTPAASPLAAVDLRLRVGGGFPTGGFLTIIKIRENEPEGSVLATAEAWVPGPQSTGEQLDVRFTLADPISVIPGYTYVIEWVSPQEGGKVLSWMASDSDTYPYGTALGCQGVQIEWSDMIFTTYTYEDQGVRSSFFTEDQPTDIYDYSAQ
jgi:hypothetical protein